MAAMAAASSRENVASLLDSVNFASDIPSKLESLRQLRAELSRSDTVLLSEFLSHLLKLLSDQSSPVRKSIAEIIGQVGSNFLELLPEIVSELMNAVDDDTPAVARQAITSATDLFQATLKKVGIQGLHASELDDSLESAWAWMLKLKEKLYSIAFQPGSDGRRLLSLKFVGAVVLAFTPDPGASAEPPTTQVNEGKALEFNISWLRRGHPLLKIGELSVEASQSLGLLLDQLRYPNVKSLSVSTIVVIINCVSAIAKKRPSFYGRILPVLLGLDPSNTVTRGIHVFGLQYTLKNAFTSCLQCTHSSATPWRDRLAGALKELKAGVPSGPAAEEVHIVNGKLKEEDRGTLIPKKEVSAEVSAEVHPTKGRKRSGDQELGETSADGDTPGKRLRSASGTSDGSPQPSNDILVGEETTTSEKPTSVQGEVDSGPVQQLVGVFGALVAQGDKAAASLEILIASISADLLAEVVMANMRNLPTYCPKTEEDEDLPANIPPHPSALERDSQFRQVSLFIQSVISSCASSKVGSEMDAKQLAAPEMKIDHMEEESHLVAETKNDAMDSSTDEGTGERFELCAAPNASDVGGFANSAEVYSAPTAQFQDVKEDSVIPGLDTVSSDGYKDSVMSSSLASAEADEISQDQAVSLTKRLQLDSLQSISTDRSEESGMKAVATEAQSGITSTATSLVSTHHFVLPKMAAPTIDLTDEEKDELQKVCFARIVEAYKQVATAGGMQLQFSLLAYLAVKFPLDLDPWTLLQKHILSDYVNHEGHDLTLRVLYKLYGEAEEQDFFSSTTATSVYEMFLLKVAETLRDSFPPSDKSLSRLLGEVPYLPKPIFELLGQLCSPEITDKDDKESQSGDRVTQGLSTVWSLILLRPPLRNVLLGIALQSAVHHLEEVRMKAIRLVANKLYPLESVAVQIEEFAKQRLLSVAKEESTTDTIDAESSSIQSKKDSDMTAPSNEQPSSDMARDCSDAHPSNISESTSNMLICRARRSMSLYFALCTKKHSLLRQIFVIYRSSPPHVKQAVHTQIPILIRTIGASPTLLGIIADPPEGSQNLLIQVLHTLTDGTLPSPELIATVKNLYEKGKDIEVLFPVLSFLTKEEVVPVFPHLVSLPPDKFQGALTRLLQGSALSGPVLTPEEVLIAIHGVDPDKEKIPLKKVTDACNACFEQRQIFTQQVIAKVLNQLVEQIPLPLLFMRTVLQAIGAFPALVDFIMGILSRLVNKQIWKYPKLWVGFLKCAQLTQPHSFSILLQLPPAQLEGALNKIPALRSPLTSHASQPDVKSTLPRSILVVLRLETDSQSANQEPTTSAATQADSMNAGDLEKNEKDKDSASVS